MKYEKPADGLVLHSAGQRATNYKNFATPYGLSTMGIMRETLLRIACDQIRQGLRAK